MPCPCCKSEAAREYFREENIPLWQCLRCGSLFFQLSDTLIHNDTGRFDPAKVAAWQSWLKKLSWVPVQRGTWLDFGAGFGEFGLALKNTFPGLEVRAYEPDTSRRNEHLSFEKEWRNRSWDVVSLLQVWSHLPDPQQTLQEIHACLNPGGWILLQTGNAAALAPEEYPNRYFPGRHYHFGNTAIVAQVAARSGFTVRSYGADPYPLAAQGIGGFREIIATLLHRRPYRLKHYRGPYQNVWFWLQKAG